jgi:hypothetical protein
MRTDDKLREALADLAPVASADGSALAGVHRAIGRRRRRQHVARIAAAVVVLALAAGTTAVVLQAEDDPADYGTDGSTPSTETTPTTPDTAEGGAPARRSLGPVSFELPEGWYVLDDRNTGNEEASGRSMCIGPLPTSYPRWDECGGLLLYQGDFLPGNEGGLYEDHQPWAWYHNNDVAQCPFAPSEGVGDPSDQVVPGPEGMEPIAQGFAPVGDKTAVYDQWKAYCEQSGESFEPRAWYLPESQVVVLDVTDHPETEEFLASFRFEEIDG